MLWLGVSHEFAVRIVARALSSEGMTRAGRSTCRVFHSYGQQLS